MFKLWWNQGAGMVDGKDKKESCILAEDENTIYRIVVIERNYAIYMRHTVVSL